jgi:hypothetical protein
MPTSHNKIITKLRERRQIEAELQDMLDSSSELAFQRRAQRIASLGSQVIPAIVDNLDRADARLLNAMGAVAAFLDRDEVVTALRQAVLQPGLSDQGRIGAMIILERFLDEPPDDELLESLSDPEGTAIASLEEVLAQAEQNPVALVEYIQGLDQQEPDVVLAVMRALQSLSEASDPSTQAQVVEPLRMMAQDVRGEIAAHALQALAATRLPDAAKALQTLIPIVHPELRPRAERSLRKLRFVGVEFSDLPDPDPTWRALVSPVNGQGQQSVWFVQESQPEARARFLNILLSDQAGAVEAVGHEQVPPLALPPRRPRGYLHDISLSGGSGTLLMLEVSFGVGRRLVLEALAHNREMQIPVAGVLRLLSPWLWGVSGADSLPQRTLPDLSAEDESLVAVSDRLLAHPAFDTWTARSGATLQAAEEALRHPHWDEEMWIRRLAGQLFGKSVVAQVFSQRLAAMSEWLLLAGEETWSQLALIAAQTIAGKERRDHPFVQGLIRRDLKLALHSLKQTNGPAFGSEEWMLSEE